MLSLIGKNYDSENTDFYRIDGLSVVKNTSGPKTGKKSKSTCRKCYVIIECNMKTKLSWCYL